MKTYHAVATWTTEKYPEWEIDFRGRVRGRIG